MKRYIEEWFPGSLSLSLSPPISLPLDPLPIQYPLVSVLTFFDSFLSNHMAHTFSLLISLFLFTAWLSVSSSTLSISSTLSPARTPFRSSSRPSRTLDPVRILPVSEPLVLSVVRPLMSLLFAVSTRLFTSSPPELATLLSVTSSRSLSVSLMRS